MSDRGVLERAGMGAVAGLAGSFAMQGLRTGSQRIVPETIPPTSEEPGKYMVERAEELLPEETRERIPEGAETAAAMMLGVGYGMTAGALFSVSGRTTGNLIADGAALGLATWAVGYMGWLPATDITPPLSEQNSKQVGGTMVRHVLYGIATVAALRWLDDRR